METRFPHIPPQERLDAIDRLNRERDLRRRVDAFWHEFWRGAVMLGIVGGAFLLAAVLIAGML